MKICNARNKEVTIVLIEDDSAHALLIKKQLKRHGIENPVVVLEDGQAGMDFFEEYKKDKQGGSILVLLDLNLPGVSGREILSHLKQDPELKMVPVIVITTDDKEETIVDSYNMGCNAFIAKPIKLEEFRLSIESLGLFLQHSVFP